jgi:hypothetical protein
MLKGGQYVKKKLNENSHKINLNVKIFGVFFSLMINMRMFFNFSLIILCFMLLKNIKHIFEIEDCSVEGLFLAYFCIFAPFNEQI